MVEQLESGLKLKTGAIERKSLQATFEPADIAQLKEPSMEKVLKILEQQNFKPHKMFSQDGAIKTPCYKAKFSEAEIEADLKRIETNSQGSNESISMNILHFWSANAQ